MTSELSSPTLCVDSPEMVLVLDHDALVLAANAEAHRALGYAPGELIGKHAREFVRGLSEERAAGLKQHLRELGVAVFASSHVRKDGSSFPAETRIARIPRHGAPALGVAFVRDLTEEEAVRRRLHAAEQRARLLMDLLPEAVVAYDRGGRITFANPAAAALAGAARAEDLVGTRVFDHVHPSSLDLARALLTETFAGAPLRLAPQERVLRRDGSAYDAEIVCAAVTPDEVLTVARDVSERRRAEAERAALESRIRQAEKLEALGTLAGGVAHDFNNVLAAILGHAQALAEELPPGSVARADAEQITAAALRAKGVVRQILAFSRQRPADPQPVDVARAIREELPLVRAATPAPVEIALRVDDGGGAVRAEPTQIHQILLNLCGNARDAMAARGGLLQIEVDPVEVPSSGAPPGLSPGPYVRIAVTDTGTGMDAATLARAFEPYFTTKPVGIGSGLGLSVVHGIATGLGGTVRLESKAGAGTRVEVWLPRLDAVEPRAPAKAPAPTPTPVGARPRVLVVDDDPAVARAVDRVLTSLGYAVTVDPSAELALERFRGAPDAFDAVVTDQTLPRMAGDELTRSLLAIRPALPVLICTGYSALEDEDARRLGARALLPKPIDRRELAEALAAALRPAP
jgi:PAS domain S-box-containing protein